MSSEWFHAHNGQQAGPLSFSQLQELARSGQLQATDQIWQEGTPAWVAAERVPGLLPRASSPQAAPAPPLAPVIARLPVTLHDLGRLFRIAQIVCWGICLAVLLVGGLLFLMTLAGSESAPQEAAAGAVFSTFFIGAYALARCVEKLSAVFASK